MQRLSITPQKIFHIFHSLFFSEINIPFFSKEFSFVFIFLRINTLWFFQTFPFFHFFIFKVMLSQHSWHRTGMKKAPTGAHPSQRFFSFLRRSVALSYEHQRTFMPCFSKSLILRNMVLLSIPNIRAAAAILPACFLMAALSMRHSSSRMMS